MAFARRNYHWPPVRERYVSSTERLTFNQLEEEFSIPARLIGIAAADEGWVSLRLKRTTAEIEKSGAHELLMAAAATQKAVTDKICDAALVIVQNLQVLAQELDSSELAVSTRSGIVNTMSFTLANVAKGLKDAGVVGLPKALMDEIEKSTPKGVDGKDHMKAVLQQVNVTINNARNGKPDTVEVDLTPKKKADASEPFVEPNRNSKDYIEVSRLLRQAEARSLAQWEEVL